MFRLLIARLSNLVYPLFGLALNPIFYCVTLLTIKLIEIKFGINILTVEDFFILITLFLGYMVFIRLEQKWDGLLKQKRVKTKLRKYLKWLEVTFASLSFYAVLFHDLNTVIPNPYLLTVYRALVTAISIQELIIFTMLVEIHSIAIEQKKKPKEQIDFSERKERSQEKTSHDILNEKRASAFRKSNKRKRSRTRNKNN